MSVERWKVDGEGLVPDDNGSWVTYSDHVAALSDAVAVAEHISNLYLNEIRNEQFDKGYTTALEKVRREVEKLQYVTIDDYNLKLNTVPIHTVLYVINRVENDKSVLP